LFILVALVSAWIPAAAQVDMRSIDASLSEAQKAWNVPGMAVAIVKDDSVVFAKGYGVREIGKPDAVDRQTLFAIASNTKAFTSALLAALVDERKVSWNDRVQQHLPYFQLYDPYVSSDTRIRDLLSHRVGLRTFSGDLIWYGTSYSREEVVRRARHLKQAYPFRSGYGYSNIMFVAAGEIVAKVTGGSWEEALQRTILGPIGMTNTVLSVNDLTGRTNVATPHGEENGVIRTCPWYNWDNLAAAGGIISNVDDMAKWMRLQLNRGQWDTLRIWSEAQSRVMWTPHNNFVVGGPSARAPHTNFSGYGLGWDVADHRGHLVVEHGGGYDGMFSQTLLVPDIKLGVIVLTNGMTGVANAVTQYVLNTYAGEVEPNWIADGVKREREARERQKNQRLSADSTRVPGTKPSTPLTAYAGTYGGPLYGDATVTLENGKLVLRLLPNPDFVADLSHWHFDVFEVCWRKAFPWFGSGKVQFVLNERTDVTEMKMNVPNNDFWFDELEFKKKLER
jgi:CubicO group peptidase (beta-lactamase class C family)